MMDRRAFIGTLAGGLLAAPLVAEAQQGKVPVVGVLYRGVLTPVALGPLGPDTPRYLAVSALRLGLRDLGYVEGQTISLQYRFAGGKPETLPRLAAELVQLKADILVAVSPAAVKAAIDATRSIPIVAMDQEGDPVQSGWVHSFGRPGGNVTGLFLDLPGLTGKWLELLREVVPRLARVAVLWDPTTGPYQLSALKNAAQGLRIDLQVLEVQDPAQYAAALATATKARPGALVQLSSPLVNAPLYVKQIADFSVKTGLPSISLFKQYAEAGGLMAYGPDQSQFLRRAAVYVDRILKGAKPGDLPVEQPRKFELVINLKTAKALGLTIPQSLLQRADQVIE